MEIKCVIIRANYLATVIFASVLVLLVGGWALRSAFYAPLESQVDNVAWILAFMSLYLVPSGRALRRLFVTGTLIRSELLDERPIVTGVVMFASFLGHFFFTITMAAAIDIALAPEWPDEAGKIAIFVVGALFWYVIALLCGELALVGKGESDAARAARSGPFC
jgi:hypothetical protein